MDVLCWWIALHPPTSLRKVLRGEESWRCLFGHVECYGLTRDATWVFYNPEGTRCRMQITHHHDEVVEMIAERRARASLILKVEPDEREYRWPIFPPMNCATQVGALLGRRAWTPRGLMRMLLRDGAEVTHENAQGTRRRESGTTARTPSCGT